MRVLRGLDLTVRGCLIVALYRRDQWKISGYVARKHDPSQITLYAPSTQIGFGETYGIMIYQEQVQAARVLAVYTLGAADILRRAMGKKSRQRWMSNANFYSRG